MDFVGGKISGPIERQQITSFVEGKRFQRFAALQLAKYILEQGPKQFRIERVEEGSQIGVAGDVFDAVDGLEVLVVSPLVES